MHAAQVAVIVVAALLSAAVVFSIRRIQTARKVRVGPGLLTGLWVSAIVSSVAVLAGTLGWVSPAAATIFGLIGIAWLVVGEVALYRGVRA